VTKILGKGEPLLAAYQLSAADVAREHLQHVLRQVERLGGGGLEGTDRDGSGASSGGVEGGGGDLEAQRQAVVLVVVYLRNLIARGILPLEIVYLDVQEICVRYIYLAEVREFRVWLQNAAEGVGLEFGGSTGGGGGGMGVPGG
jgi:hypothetical protein